MKQGFRWFLAMAMGWAASVVGAATEEAAAARAPLTEANAVYDDFEGSFGYGWSWSKTASWLSMPATEWSKQGLLTNASNAKPGKDYLPFVGTTADATADAWTVSVYGVLSCPDDAGIWSFGNPGATADTAYHVGLVRRANHVLQVVHGVPGGAEGAPVAPRVLCEATVEGLDTDSRLYTVVSDGATVRLLVDGTEVAGATPENAGDLTVHAAWQVGAFTGSKPAAAGLAFADGMAIDAVALQGRALSDGEIAALAAHVFPRVPGVNVAVPAVGLPEGWAADAPAFARVYGVGTAESTAYRRLRKPGATAEWRVGALTASEGGNIGGPGAGDGKPAELFALGGAPDSLVGGAHATASRTYSGDTLVVVGGARAKVVAGGVNSYGTDWRKPVTATFKGVSSVLVREILPEGMVLGGSCSTSASDGGAVVHEGASSVRVEIPEAEGVFGATVLGGSWDDRQTTAASTAAGDASVTIDAPNVTFAGKIVAGNGANMTQKSGSAALVLRAGAFTGSLLPSDGPKGATLPSTLSIEGDIDLSQATVGAFDTLTLAGRLALGAKRCPGITLAEPTAAATLAFVLTEEEKAAGAAIVLCKTVFDTLPETLTLSPSNGETGWGPRVTPDRRLVYAPLGGDHTWADGDIAWAEAFPDWSEGDTAVFEAPAEGTRTVTLGEGVAAESVTFRGANRLLGPGALSAVGVALGDGATLALPREAEQGFRHLRLTLGKNQSGTTTNLALAELLLTRGGEPVAWPLGTLIADGKGATPAWTGNEAINALIDRVFRDASTLPAVNPADGGEKGYATSANVHNNKWFVSKSTDSNVAVISLGAPVVADGYTLWTSDTPSRTPSEWTLEVSEDGKAWRLFDARSGVSGFDKHAAYDYVATGSACVKVGVLTLGEGVALDLSEGFAPIVADEVRGTGGTIALPAGGLSARVPFLVTPTRGLTFTVKDDEGAYHRVVYVAGAYCVEPNTLVEPFSAIVGKASAWADLPWKDAEGHAVPARVWADGAFAPDVALTFSAGVAVTLDTRTVGDLVVTADSSAVGRLLGKGVALTMGLLDVRHDVLVGPVRPTRVHIAAGANLTADIGADVGDWVWECAVEGEGSFVKRGSNRLTLNGKVAGPRIVHGWNEKSTLVFGQDYAGAIFFSRATAHASNILGDSNAGGGGKVEVPEGVTLTLTEGDVGSEPNKGSRDAVLVGKGRLVLPEGASLSLADGHCLDASALAAVEVKGPVTVKVADPSVGRALLRCAAPAADRAARLSVVTGDGNGWDAQALDGTGYVLAILPMPAEGHGLEGEVLRAVREAAAAAGLSDGFTVRAKTSADKDVASPADVLGCFSGLPLEASSEGGECVTVRCDFGIAALRFAQDDAGAPCLLLKAQVLNGDFAEGTAITVLGDGDEIFAVPLGESPVGEMAGKGERWLRVPLVEGGVQLAVRVTRTSAE